MINIVTANFNGSKFIDDYLKSLVEQSNQNFNVVIVDNNSTDDSLDRIKKYSSRLNLHIIELDYNSGFAKANNLGINYVINNSKDDSDSVFTLNNDTELDKECIQKLYEALENYPDYDGFQGVMINYFERKRIDAAGINIRLGLPYQIGFGDSVENLASYSEDIFGPCAGAALFKLRALKEVILLGTEVFDEDYFAYFEDVDLVLRLRNKNKKFRLIKDAIIYHIHSATSVQNSPFKEYYLERNLHLLHKKNFKGFNLLLVKANHYRHFNNKLKIVKASEDDELLKALYEGRAFKDAKLDNNNKLLDK